jgi:tripartite-type tricarboxylate transporter receptor subunit TctC
MACIRSHANALVIAVAMLGTVAAKVHADVDRAPWPVRPIKLVVPVAAGGGVDLMARILAEPLAQQLSQRVVIENVGGGGGSIGARQVSNADPDGYTFLFAAPGHAAVPFMHKQPPYDPIKDFSPVSLVAQFPLVVVINPSIKAQTLAEFIALLKANPGKYTFGSSGVGGSSHMPVELFKFLAGVDLLHVPFRGNSQSAAALLAGQIDLIIDGLAPQLGNIAEGRVRVLGVTTRGRTAFLPDVPAVSEVLPGYEFPMWVGLFAPAKTPRGVVDKFSSAVASALREPTTRKRYTDIKVDPAGSTPDEFDQFFREQLKFSADIIKRANIILQD